jgi:hypothetical protein
LQDNAEEIGILAAEFSTQVANQTKEQLLSLEEDLRESLSGLTASLEGLGLSEEKLEQIKAHFEESSLQAAQKAEMAAVKAKAKMEKSIYRARQKAQKIAQKSKEFDLNGFLALQAEKMAVSDKERMMILEMLQKKKITPEEADSLLKALEGKNHDDRR